MKFFFLYLMALLYLMAGVNHFRHPEMYLKIMPPWLPAHQLLVALSGWAEIILAALLCIPLTKIFAAWGIIFLLLLVFPANIQMCINYWRQQNPYLWITILRLPLQLFLIWWAYYYTRH